MQVPTWEEIHACIERVNVILLTPFGRSGLLLLHSLIDNHKEIITMPIEYRGYAVFDKNKIQNSIDKTISLYEPLWNITKSFLFFEEVILNHTYEKSNYVIDTDKFSSTVKAVCKIYIPGSARDLFVIANIAYHICQHKNISNISYILVDAHLMSVDQQQSVIKDFPCLRVIVTCRDPRESVMSLCDVFARESGIAQAPFCFFTVKILHVLHQLGVVSKIISTMPLQHVAMVDLNTLHAAGDTALSKLAAWLGVEDTDTLRRSTFNGQAWLGNSGNGKSRLGLNAQYAVLQYPSKMSIKLVALIDAFFSSFYQKLGYAPPAHAPSLPKARNMLLCNSFRWMRLPFSHALFDAIYAKNEGKGTDIIGSGMRKIVKFLHGVKLYIVYPMVPLFFGLILFFWTAKKYLHKIIDAFPDAAQCGLTICPLTYQQQNERAGAPATMPTGE